MKHIFAATGACAAKDKLRIRQANLSQLSTVGLGEVDFCAAVEVGPFRKETAKLRCHLWSHLEATRSDARTGGDKEFLHTRAESICHSSNGSRQDS